MHYKIISGGVKCFNDLEWLFFHLLAKAAYVKPVILITSLPLAVTKRKSIKVVNFVLCTLPNSTDRQSCAHI